MVIYSRSGKWCECGAGRGKVSAWGMHAGKNPTIVQAKSSNMILWKRFTRRQDKHEAWHMEKAGGASGVQSCLLEPWLPAKNILEDDVDEGYTKDTSIPDLDDEEKTNDYLMDKFLSIGGSCVENNCAIISAIDDLADFLATPELSTPKKILLEQMRIEKIVHLLPTWITQKQVILRNYYTSEKHIVDEGTKLIALYWLQPSNSKSDIFCDPDELRKAYATSKANIEEANISASPISAQYVADTLNPLKRIKCIGHIHNYDKNTQRITMFEELDRADLAVTLALLLRFFETLPRLHYEHENILSMLDSLGIVEGRPPVGDPKPPLDGSITSSVGSEWHKTRDKHIEMIQCSILHSILLLCTVEKVKWTTNVRTESGDCHYVKMHSIMVPAVCNHVVVFSTEVRSAASAAFKMLSTMVIANIYKSHPNASVVRAAQNALMQKICDLDDKTDRDYRSLMQQFDQTFKTSTYALTFPTEKLSYVVNYGVCTIASESTFLEDYRCRGIVKQFRLIGTEKWSEIMDSFMMFESYVTNINRVNADVVIDYDEVCILLPQDQTPTETSKVQLHLDRILPYHDSLVRIWCVGGCPETGTVALTSINYDYHTICSTSCIPSMVQRSNKFDEVRGGSFFDKLVEKTFTRRSDLGFTSVPESNEIFYESIVVLPATLSEDPFRYVLSPYDGNIDIPKASKYIFEVSGSLHNDSTIVFIPGVLIHGVICTVAYERDCKQVNENFQLLFGKEYPTFMEKPKGLVTIAPSDDFNDGWQLLEGPLLCGITTSAIRYQHSPSGNIASLKFHSMHMYAAEHMDFYGYNYFTDKSEAEELLVTPFILPEERLRSSNDAEYFNQHYAKTSKAYVVDNVKAAIKAHCISVVDGSAPNSAIWKQVKLRTVGYAAKQEIDYKPMPVHLKPCLQIKDLFKSDVFCMEYILVTYMSHVYAEDGQVSQDVESGLTAQRILDLMRAYRDVETRSSALLAGSRSALASWMNDWEHGEKKSASPSEGLTNSMNQETTWDRACFHLLQKIILKARLSRSKRATDFLPDDTLAVHMDIMRFRHVSITKKETKKRCKKIDNQSILCETLLKYRRPKSVCLYPHDQSDEEILPETPPADTFFIIVCEIYCLNPRAAHTHDILGTLCIANCFRGILKKVRTSESLVKYFDTLTSDQVQNIHDGFENVFEGSWDDDKLIGRVVATEIATLHATEAASVRAKAMEKRNREFKNLERRFETVVDNALVNVRAEVKEKRDHEMHSADAQNAESPVSADLATRLVSTAANMFSKVEVFGSPRTWPHLTPELEKIAKEKIRQLEEEQRLAREQIAMLSMRYSKHKFLQSLRDVSTALPNLLANRADIETNRRLQETQDTWDRIKNTVKFLRRAAESNNDEDFESKESMLIKCKLKHPTDFAMHNFIDTEIKRANGLKKSYSDFKNPLLDADLAAHNMARIHQEDEDRKTALQLQEDEFHNDEIQVHGETRSSKEKKEVSKKKSNRINRHMNIQNMKRAKALSEERQQWQRNPEMFETLFRTAQEEEQDEAINFFSLGLFYMHIRRSKANDLMREMRELKRHIPRIMNEVAKRRVEEEEVRMQTAIEVGKQVSLVEM